MKKKNIMVSKRKKRSDVMDHGDMVVSGADDNLKNVLVSTIAGDG